MQSSSAILIFGKDSHLLDTRCWVLQRAGHRAWPATELSDFGYVGPSEGFDLVILCHSLSKEQRRRAIILAEALWPGVQTMVLMSWPSGYDPGPKGHPVDASEGPEKLLKAVEILVGARSQIHLRAA